MTDETLKIGRVKEALKRLKSKVDNLLLLNKKLERENILLKRQLADCVDAAEFEKLKRELNGYRAKENILRKKVSRLVVRLEKLEMLDKEIEEEVGSLDG